MNNQYICLKNNIDYYILYWGELNYIGYLRIVLIFTDILIGSGF